LAVTQARELLASRYKTNPTGFRGMQVTSQAWSLSRSEQAVMGRGRQHGLQTMSRYYVYYVNYYYCHPILLLLLLMFLLYYHYVYVSLLRILRMLSRYIYRHQVLHKTQYLSRRSARGTAKLGNSARVIGHKVPHCAVSLHCAQCKHIWPLAQGRPQRNRTCVGHRSKVADIGPPMHGACKYILLVCAMQGPSYQSCHESGQ
jgi:hypothetical protein